MQHGQQNPSFVDGVTPIFKTPYGVFCFLKGGTGKVCSLRSYAVLTKTPTKNVTFCARNLTLWLQYFQPILCSPTFLRVLRQLVWGKTKCV